MRESSPLSEVHHRCEPSPRPEFNVPMEAAPAPFQGAVVPALLRRTLCDATLTEPSSTIQVSSATKIKSRIPLRSFNPSHRYAVQWSPCYVVRRPVSQARGSGPQPFLFRKQI
jgi:hypothetical protein